MAKYPTAKYSRTDAYCYCFKVYQDNGDKFNSDFYTLKGITKMKAMLEKANETFTISIADKNGSVEEVSI